MLFYFCTLIIGFILTAVGIISIICFMNLFTVGYNLNEYIHFISNEWLCWCLPIGLIILVICTFTGGKK
jgi:hypothetical protein